MASSSSSSRLVGRLLSLPRPRIDTTYHALPSHLLIRASYATDAATSHSSEVDRNSETPAAVSDPSVLKSSKTVKYLRSIGKIEEAEAAAKLYQRTRKTKAPSKEASVYKDQYIADIKSAFPHLPNEKDWKFAFKLTNSYKLSHRQFVTNKETIEEMVQSMNLAERSKAAGRKLTILECYPGPGTLTRRFLQDENVERVIAIEAHPGFNAWLQELSTDATLGTDASKLKVVTKDCFNWETYTETIDEGLLDHIPAFKNLKDQKVMGTAQFGDDWQAASPILLVGQFSTTVLAEQLIAQFTAAIARRQWQFRYTRMPMFFVCSEHVAWRCTAQTSHRLRCRMSILAQAVAEPKILLDEKHFSPHEDHFWPYTHTAGPRLPRTTAPEIRGGKVTGNLSQYGHCFLLIEPRAKVLLQDSEVDALEFLLRSIFIRKANSIKSCLVNIAPGAANLLEAMKKGHPALSGLGNVEIDPKTIITDLKHTDFVALAKMFERWPFKPRSYFDGISASPQEIAEYRESVGNLDSEVTSISQDEVNVDPDFTSST